MSAADQVTKYQKRLAIARQKERYTATRLRRLVTALQGWQEEAVKCERRIIDLQPQVLSERLRQAK